MDPIQKGIWGTNPRYCKSSQSLPFFCTHWGGGNNFPFNSDVGSGVGLGGPWKQSGRHIRSVWETIRHMHSARYTGPDTCLCSGRKSKFHPANRSNWFICPLRDATYLLPGIQVIDRGGGGASGDVLVPQVLARLPWCHTFPAPSQPMPSFFLQPPVHRSWDWSQLRRP